MFSGNEWVAVLAVLAVAALIVLLTVRAVRGSAAKPTRFRARVHGDAQDVVRDLQLELSGVRNTVAHRGGDESLTAVWSFVPNWAIVVAVLFFPLGLIALVARRTVTGTVLALPATDGTTELTMGGKFNGHAIAAINTVIGHRS